MAVRHFLKDGTEVKTISGRVIKEKDFETLYRIIRSINERRNNGNIRTNQSRK